MDIPAVPAVNESTSSEKNIISKILLDISQQRESTMKSGSEETEKGDNKEISPINVAYITVLDKGTGLTVDHSATRDDDDVDDDDDDDVEAALSKVVDKPFTQAWVAPDGGYGWVIVFCALVVSLIVDGLTYTFGVFIGELQRVFKKPKSTIALASSLQVGIYLFVGPIVSALTNRFGCRPVIVVGSLVAGLAYIASAWCTDITVFIIIYGFVAGVGFGMMYLPAIVAVSVYFQEKRAVATGIAVCGSGIGTFILAPLTDLLLYEYNWSWTLLILGGIVLNGMVLGLLVRPLDFKKVEVKYEDKEVKILKDEDESGKTQGKDTETSIARMESKPKRIKKTSTSSVGSRHENAPLITYSEGQKFVDTKLNSKPEETTVRFFSSTPNFVNTSLLPRTTSRKGSNRFSINSSEHGFRHYRSNTMDNVARPNFQHSHTIFGRPSASTSKSRAQAPLGLAFISVSDAHLNRIRDDVQLPLSRKDIHLSEALGVQKNDKGVGLYFHSIRSIASMGKDGLDETGGEARGLWRCLPTSARDTLEEMLDLSILKDRSYWFVLMGNFFCMVGFYVPFVYIPDMAKMIGIGEDEAAFLVSIIGITNTIGRVGTGVLMNFLDIDCVLVTSVALAIAGITTALCPFCYTFWSLALASAVFGVCVAAYISLCSVLLCELLGVENLTNAFGFVILFRGVACIMGPPIAGAIIDGAGIFDPAFFVGGGMIVLGAISHALLLAPCYQRQKNLT